MNQKRPVDLKLTAIKLPITAWASILHRISGILMIFIIGFWLFFLDKSLTTEENYNQIYNITQLPIAKIIIWSFLTVFIYHFCAGIKHLLMDIGYFEEKRSGHIASIVLFILTFILSLLAGVWII